MICAKGKVYKMVIRPAMLNGLKTANDQEIRNRASSGRVEDVKIFFRSYENEQN